MYEKPGGELLRKRGENRIQDVLQTKNLSCTVSIWEAAGKNHEFSETGCFAQKQILTADER